MVRVNFYYQTNNIISVTFEGHSNFDQYGEDIVCAGISAVVFGTLNALDNLVQADILIKKTSNNNTITVLKPNNNNQMILKTMFYQLKTISDQYKENINVKEVY